MGLLDDLKRQADTLRTQTSLQRSNREENVRIVDEGMHKAFLYVLELFKQLAVIQPVNPVAYVLPGVGEMRNLRYVDSFIDARKKKFSDRDVYDYTNFWVKWGSPTTLTTERIMPAEIKKVRDQLYAANIKFTEEEIKKDGSLQKVVFKMGAAIIMDFELVADHDNRRLAFYGKNSLRLGMDDFAVPADDVTDAVLEELAKLLLGQASEFGRKYRTVLPRRAA
jgi:hypothetical protein